MQNISCNCRILYCFMNFIKTFMQVLVFARLASGLFTASLHLNRLQRVLKIKWCHFKWLYKYKVASYKQTTKRWTCWWRWHNVFRVVKTTWVVCSLIDLLRNGPHKSFHTWKHLNRKLNFNGEFCMRNSSKTFSGNTIPFDLARQNCGNICIILSIKNSNF